MRIGYPGVSTTDQNSDLQEDALQKAGCEKIFRDVGSAAVDSRRGLAEAMVISAIVLWNTVYLEQAAQWALERQGRRGYSQRDQIYILPFISNLQPHQHTRSSFQPLLLIRSGQIENYRAALRGAASAFSGDSKMNFRSETNRANAQHSTGPVTAAGKETSSRNALTHGLTSKKLTLNPEEREQFNKLLASYTATYKPVTQAEKTQLKYMTEHFWRLERALKIEQILFDRTASEIAEENPEMSYDEAVSVMFIDPRYTKRLSLFMRYKGQLDRAWRKALAELEKLIAARVKEEATQTKINNLIANRFVSSFAPETPETRPDAAEPTGHPAELRADR